MYRSQTRAHLHTKTSAIEMVASGQATVAEVARLCGVSRQKLQQWCQHSHHVAFRIPNPMPPLDRQSQPIFDVDILQARRHHLEKLWVEFST
jgi:transposase-like protein